jgi:hypothetical protein
MGDDDGDRGLLPSPAGNAGINRSPRPKGVPIRKRMPAFHFTQASSSDQSRQSEAIKAGKVPAGVFKSC